MNEIDKVMESIKEREVFQGIEIANLKAELKDCVNELCLMCGSYKTAHLGSCDGCRWKAVKEGFR